MKTKKINLRIISSAALLCLTLAQPVSAYQSPEAQSFITGFNAFKAKDYQNAIKQFSTVLGQPDSQLRELTLVFLSRSYFKGGNVDEASYLLHLWKQEYPESTLSTTLEQDLLRETAKSDIKTILARKEQEQLARENAERERLAAIKAEEERKAKERAEAERIAKEKAAAERLANHRAAIFAAANTPDMVITYPSGVQTATAGRELTIPLTITNPGTVPDRFSLGAKLPSGWEGRFSIDGQNLSMTPELAPGAVVKSSLSVAVPATALEGQQLNLPLSLISTVAPEKQVSGTIQLVASAPIVRAVVKTLDSVNGDPGRAQCLVSVLNVGSADAESLNVTISHPSSYVAVSEGSVAFSRGSEEKIKVSRIRLQSGGLEEFLINFKLKDANSGKRPISCNAELLLK